MSTLPAVPDSGIVGLEDYDPTVDGSTPRLQIVQAEAVFKDSQSGEEWSKISCIVLGRLKQRILWPPEVEEGKKAKPLCKSLDFRIGLPGEEFPWEKSGFDKSVVGETLDCGACPLKEWDSHPTRETPWCSEQSVLPLLMEVAPDVWAPTILTLQRSSLKPARKYIDSYGRAKLPLFTAFTTIELDAQKRGSVKYATPTFTKGAATEEANWPEYANQWRNLRTFLMTVRNDDDDEEETVAAPATGGPKSKAADSDELDW